MQICLDLRLIKVLVDYSEYDIEAVGTKVTVSFKELLRHRSLLQDLFEVDSMHFDRSLKHRPLCTLCGGEKSLHFSL